MIGQMRVTTASRLVPAVSTALLLLAVGDRSALSQPDEGQIEFNNHCRTCHTVDEDDHRLGPSLHNILGSEAGSSPGYSFSDAMSASELVWDEENLDRFIENPDAVIRGHNMEPYAGIADPEIRAAIVGYLADQSANSQ